MTFLKPENTRNLYALPGLDYVAHDDILPYSTSDKSPIQHELFDKFLACKDGENSEESVFEAQTTLNNWQEKNHPWLELSEVHKETTEDIRVTVIPFYMGFKENQNVNVYWVRILSLIILRETVEGELKKIRNGIFSRILQQLLPQSLRFYKQR